jgi:hypothetical protein
MFVSLRSVLCGAPGAQKQGVGQVGLGKPWGAGGLGACRQGHGTPYGACRGRMTGVLVGDAATYKGNTPTPARSGPYVPKGRDDPSRAAGCLGGPAHPSRGVNRVPFGRSLGCCTPHWT